ncbi:TetR family transcriptional regulator [Nocardia sp. NPDC005366]|uniref:TetR/AcrR family transcriptional regulator n=1 Tax=Nocardia sp. NPDC005366 TaxID=3156878 RepID=UPI0033BC2A06
MVLREQKKLKAWRTIRAEALRLFEERGYEATTIEQIVAAAGVSRATFFNYFDAKASVVFDQDPAERVAWHEMMDSQPDALPLWDALGAIILQMTESLGGRMLLLRQLKQNDPVLVQATQAYGHSFLEELTSGVQARAERLDSDELASKLQTNVALACAPIRPGVRTRPSRASSAARGDVSGKGAPQASSNDPPQPEHPGIGLLPLREHLTGAACPTGGSRRPLMVDTEDRPRHRTPGRRSPHRPDCSDPQRIMTHDHRTDTQPGPPLRPPAVLGDLPTPTSIPRPPQSLPAAISTHSTRSVEY